MWFFILEYKIFAEGEQKRSLVSQYSREGSEDMTFEQAAAELGASEAIRNIQILAEGFRGIDIDYISTPQIFSPEKMKQVDEEWERRTRRSQHHLFNGPLASLSAFGVNNQGIVELVLRRSSYKLYVGTRGKGFFSLNPEQVPLDENHCLPLSFGAVTLTSDNYIVLGLRSRTDTGQGMLGSVPSGYLDPERHTCFLEGVGKQISFDSLVEAELREELKGIAGFISSSRECLSLIQWQQPLVAIRLRMPYTRAELKGLLQADPTDEHSRIIMVKNSMKGVREALQQYEFTPHALGAIVSHFSSSA